MIHQVACVTFKIAGRNISINTKFQTDGIRNASNILLLYLWLFVSYFMFTYICQNVYHIMEPQIWNGNHPTFYRYFIQLLVNKLLIIWLTFCQQWSMGPTKKKKTSTKNQKQKFNAEKKNSFEELLNRQGTWSSPIANTGCVIWFVYATQTVVLIETVNATEKNLRIGKGKKINIFFFLFRF